MKRMISCLLAVILALAPCLQVNALGMDGVDIQVSQNTWEGDETDRAEILSATVSGTEVPVQEEEEGDESVSNGSADVSANGADDPEQQEEMVSENETDAIGVTTTESEEQATVVEKKDLGKIDVVVVAALALKKPVEFTASATGIDGTTQEKKFTLKESVVEKDGQEEVSVVQGNTVLDGLLPQEYTLTVRAPGFAAYTQSIIVKDSLAYRVQLMTGDVKGFDFENGPHPGILLIGDVDGDGTITEQDREKLIKAIESGIVEEGTDLNGDGKMNLADLEYFTKGYRSGLDIKSTEERYVPHDAVTVSHNNAVLQRGSIEDLLKSEGSLVGLSPSDGKDISSDNAVEVEFQLDGTKNLPVGGIVIGIEQANPITGAGFTITYEDADGKEQKIEVPYADQREENANGIEYMLRSRAAEGLSETVKVTKDPVSGAIQLDLGSQVPIKKVTFRITGVKKNNDLAEISKVEFISDMASRIPEPQLDIPENVNGTSESQAFTVTWDPRTNVTGYEVMVTEQTEEGASGDTAAQSCVKQVTGPTIKVSSIGEGKSGKIVNGKKYIVKVRSANGTWRSPYSKEWIAEPRSEKVPDAPDNLKLTGKYRSIAASWKDMDDTVSYNLYYKKADDAADYQVIKDIKTNSYTITGLDEEIATYEVYVTGCNAKGEGSPSLKRQVKTTDLSPAKMPRYKRINEAVEGKVSGHVISATAVGGGEMKESPLDTGTGTILGTIDNDNRSYYRIASWDLGGFNDNNNGLVYEFDQPYKIQNIALQSSEMEYTDFSYARIHYWGEDGTRKSVPASFQKKQDEDDKEYYWFRFSEPVTAKKIKIGLGRYLATSEYNLITVSEVNFYHYDPIEEDINKLYEDDLHTVLKGDVTQATIDGLRQRVNTPDEITGEYHPEKVLLEKELKTAEDILNAKGLSSPVRIHRDITTKEPGRGFSGLNGWQPLGVTAAAGEKLIVYVGHKSMRTGEGTGLSLVATQYHAESDGLVNYTSGQLVIGRNEITIPRVKSPVTGCEAGGALYVQYGGASASDDLAVRVDGGVAVPVLDLHKVTDAAERQKRTEEYVTALSQYVAGMEQTHKERHEGSDYVQVDWKYDVRNCILGATDILLDKMLLSIPAQQVLNGAGDGAVAQKAQKIVKSMDAMEEMMHLFYQHKGLNENAADAIDKVPSTHLNIRYQRMFAGAFMYAGGNHIGIEYGSTAGMVSGVPVQTDENGKWISGQYFGWGIAHEIGHDINQGAYAVAEVTNNYFSVLAQAKDTDDSVRFQYPNVYDKVTSGTKGPASNVFTQLGMYWQLHLAYDNGYNYKTYADHAEQLQNLFFARVDTYARTPGKAPKPGNVALVLDGDSDQKLMRLACAAAEKNILDFFERWGKTPDEGTIAYAGQFEKETRAIYYGSDEARVYRLEGKGSALSPDGTTEAVGNGTTAKVNSTVNNQVDLTFDQTAIPESDLLGYEVVRCTTSNGDVEEQAVGFANKYNDFTFSDHVTTVNNRVVTYKVTVIDKYLNRSASKTLEPLKIEHKGNIDKTNWTVSYNNITSVDPKEVIDASEDIPCAPEEIDPIQKIIDDDAATTYVGKLGANGEVILEFNRVHTVTALQYRVGSGTQIKDYSICIWDQEAKDWKEVAAGTFDQAGDQTVYFKNANGIAGNIGAYRTDKVKLVIKDAAGTDVSISELDVLGPAGDNVDLRSDSSGQPAIGKLAAAYKYEGGEIPAGSIVFTGSYRGNSAYNVVIIYDQNGNIVGGTKKDENGGEGLDAHQLVFSTVPEEGEIQDVYDGTWVYWIQPDETIDLSSLKQVRAELYRVDNALTNEGQRLVSDSLFKTMPSTLPDITISGAQ